MHGIRENLADEFVFRGGYCWLGYGFCNLLLSRWIDLLTVLCGNSEGAAVETLIGLTLCEGRFIKVHGTFGGRIIYQMFE